MKKKALPNLGFADSKYLALKEKHGCLYVYMEMWDERIIEITFTEVIQFYFSPGDFTDSLYKIEDDSILSSAVEKYYGEKIQAHSYNIYQLLDICDSIIIQVIAEDVKYRELKHKEEFLQCL